MTVLRKYSFIDKAIHQVDQGLRTLAGTPEGTHRPDPSTHIESVDLTPEDTQKSIRLMRVNHTGEVCAQALYQGQALTAHSEQIRCAMEQAALEENDHLAWCQHRIEQLGGHTSYLNPFWWIGSYGLGAFAGWVGDKWSLGFLAETERQVCLHLKSHLNQLPELDYASKAILSQMVWDEQQHADHAIEQGGVSLPFPIPKLMNFTSKWMTSLSYYV